MAHQVNEFGSKLHVICKNEPKMEKDQDIRAKTIILLEENIAVNLCELGLGNGFSDIITKAQGTKEKK